MLLSLPMKNQPGLSPCISHITESSTLAKSDVILRPYSIVHKLNQFDSKAVDQYNNIFLQPL